MTCAASMGVKAKFLTTADGASPNASAPWYTWSSSSNRHEFHAESFAKRGRILQKQGITGSRSRLMDRTRVGSYLVGGSVSMNVNPFQLDTWLPRILGAAESTDVFDLAETVPHFGMLIDRVADIFEYKYCRVDRAVISGRASLDDSQPEVIHLGMEMLGFDENTSQSWPSPEPALEYTDSNNRPYILADAVLTIDGTTYQLMDFALMVDNHLIPRWTNSLIPTSICASDRTVRFRTTNPFTSTELALYTTKAENTTGFTVTMVFTNGTVSTTITLRSVQWAQESPVVGGRGEIPLQLNMQAFATDASTLEITVTNDSAS